MQIEQIINAVHTIPESSMQLLKQYVHAVDFPRGHILFRAGKLESKIFFIRKGMVRAYAIHDGNEITFWFGKEGDAVVSMKSYVANEKGYEDIELLEPCELYEVESAQLQQLFLQDIHLANWGRKFAEQELIKTEERLISRQFGTAIDRYKQLLENNPGLIQRAQLGHIASYLGITQVSLSRIRAELSR